MSLSSGTNLSVLSGVLRRLPTMLCCAVATPSVGDKFSNKTGARKRMAAHYSRPVLIFTSQSLIDNITLFIDVVSVVIKLYSLCLSESSESGPRVTVEASIFSSFFNLSLLKRANLSLNADFQVWLWSVFFHCFHFACCALLSDTLTVFAGSFLLLLSLPS